MHREPLTSQLVGEELKRLFAVFPSKLAAQNIAFTAETYKNGLKGIDGHALRGAVDIVIQNDSYFPKVARLREAAGVWTKYNRPALAPRMEAAWNVCPVCRAEAVRPMVTRPKLFDRGTDTEHYRTVKGEQVRRGDLLTAQASGAVFETETVQSDRTEIHHRPEAHHITKGEPDEYQGVA